MTFSFLIVCMPYMLSVIKLRMGMQRIGESVRSKFCSLKKNQDFQVVYKRGSSRANRLLVMIVRKNDSPDNRIGISVSKKVGNSVVRHHITRLIREIFRLHWDGIRGGYDIVVVARAGARESGYSQMESAVLHLLRLHHLLEEESL